MNYILFDGPHRDALLPFTFIRPVCEIRVGILTIKEKWEQFLGLTCATLTEEYLEEKHPMLELDTNIFIDASILPTKELVSAVKSLTNFQMLIQDEIVIAFHSSIDQVEVDFENYEKIEFEHSFLQITTATDIYNHNDSCIRSDYELLTHDRISQKISVTNQILGEANVFLEEGATVEFATINADNGPVYIGKNALVMEGTLIRGPLALGEGATLKMGAKLYGGTTIGPNCVVGGEVKNVVFFGNSNKGHEGYLGNSVVGEWCNFGADTNASNLKNNLSTVRLWDYQQKEFLDSGLQKVGLLFGDYSMTAINSMFNTGTTVGICCNVFGNETPKKYLANFSWGIKGESYKLEKVLDMIRKIQATKNKEFSEHDENILRFLEQQKI